MKLNRRYKIKPLLFIIAILLIGSIGITYAYFKSQGSFVNEFNTSTYNVTIEEEFYDTWGTKKVSFVNKETSNTPVVLRINYNEIWYQEVEDLGRIPLSNNVNGTNVVTKEWTEEFTSNFVLGSAGWYYYKKVLASESSVQVLKSIELNEELIKTSPYYEDYKNYNYELSFNFEAIQASVDAVKEIWGYTIEINGEEITWNL